jgi:hypothetical protein
MKKPKTPTNSGDRSSFAMLSEKKGSAALGIVSAKLSRQRYRYSNVALVHRGIFRPSSDMPCKAPWCSEFFDQGLTCVMSTVVA